MPGLKKLSRLLRRILSRLPTDPRVSLLRSQLQAWRVVSDRSKFNFVSVGSDTPEGRCIAVQGVEDPIFYGLFAAIVGDLKAVSNVRANIIQVRSINGAVGTGFLPTVLRSAPLTWLFNAQWARANAGLLDEIAYRSSGWEWPGLATARRKRARALLRNLPAGGLVALEVDGIKVGDLLIDSYLRYRPAPTVHFDDPFLVHLLAQMLRDLDLAKAWFTESRPAMYLSSYSTYIEHGVAVRVALAQRVPVWVFGNMVTFGKRLSLEDPYHAPSGGDYREIAEALADPEPALAKAKILLEYRLNGGIDQATIYMQQSAYSPSDVKVPDLRGAVVVFLHDFFDSPHIYPDLVFDDFWKWVCFTVRTLTATGIPFFLKPHPNQITESVKVVEQLKEKFPTVEILSARITNRELVHAGLGAGVTVYGTVAHELAYFGVPVICCARHPHHAFDFCRTASSIVEYESFLRQPFERPVSTETMRNQALQFYYSHNMHGEPEILALRCRFRELLKAGNSNQAAPEELVVALAALRAESGWLPFIQNFLKDLR